MNELKKALSVVLASSMFLYASTPTEIAELDELSLSSLLEIDITESGSFFKFDSKMLPGQIYSYSRPVEDGFGLSSLSQIIDKRTPSMNLALHPITSDIIGVRGVVIDCNAKTLLLRDGTSMSMRQHYGFMGGQLSTPLLGDVEKVEIAVSPGAILYGSGAINGYINLLTPSGKSMPGTWSRLSYGSGHDIAAEASYGALLSDKMNLYNYMGYHQSAGVDMHWPFRADEFATNSPTANGKAATPSPSDQTVDAVKVGRSPGEYKYTSRLVYGDSSDFLTFDGKVFFQTTALAPTALFWNRPTTESWDNEIRMAAGFNGGNSRLGPFRSVDTKQLQVIPQFKLNLNAMNSITLTPSYNVIGVYRKNLPELDNELARLVKLNPGYEKQIATYNQLISVQKAAATPDTVAIKQYNTSIDSLTKLIVDPDRVTNYGYGEIHSTIKAVYKTEVIPNHKLAVGGEVSKKEFKENFTFFGDEGLSTMAGENELDYEWKEFSAFAEDLATVGKDLVLIGGVRYDRAVFSTLTFRDGNTLRLDPIDNVVGRFAAAYKVHPQHIVKASWQQGFRFADQHYFRANAEKMLKDTVAVNAGLDYLKPEGSHHFEAGYAGDFLDKRLTLTGTAFYNIYNDMLAWNTDPKVNTFANSSTVFKVVGMDLGVSGKPHPTVETGVTYSYALPFDSYDNVVRIANEDDSFTKYPMHMVKANALFALRGFTVGGLLKFRTGAYVDDATLDPTMPQEVKDIWETPEVSADISAGYSIDQKIGLNVSCQGIPLTDYEKLNNYGSQWSTRSGFRADGPTYNASMTFKL